jgi:hypothetical protein
MGPIHLGFVLRRTQLDLRIRQLLSQLFAFIVGGFIYLFHPLLKGQITSFAIGINRLLKFLRPQYSFHKPDQVWSIQLKLDGGKPFRLGSLIVDVIIEAQPVSKRLGEPIGNEQRATCVAASKGL